MEQKELKSKLNEIIELRQQNDTLYDFVVRYLMGEINPQTDSINFSKINAIRSILDVFNSIEMNTSKTQIPISPVRYAGIPIFTYNGKIYNFKYKLVGTNGCVINTDQKCQLKNHTLGYKLKLSKNGNQEKVTLSEDGIILQISIGELMAITFGIIKPNIIENKIVTGTKKIVEKQGTRRVIKRFDETKPFSLDNLYFDFWWRGEQHWNHKLNNELVYLIRSNLDMKIKDFMEKYGNRFEEVKVCLQTIKNIFDGKTWRVRVEPLDEMTYPEEVYPIGRFTDLMDQNRINWRI